MSITLEKNGKYRARVSIGNGKRKSLGRFDTELKAKRAVNKWRKEQALEQEKHDEFGESWAEKNKSLEDFHLEFEEREPKRPFQLNPSTPSIMTRIKGLLARGNEWLKRQLDN